MGQQSHARGAFDALRDPGTVLRQKAYRCMHERRQGNEKAPLLKYADAGGGTWLQWGLREPRGWQPQGRQPRPLPMSQCSAAHSSQSFPTTLGRQTHLPVSSSQGTFCCVPSVLQAHPETGRVLSY